MTVAIFSVGFTVTYCSKDLKMINLVFTPLSQVRYNPSHCANEEAKAQSNQDVFLILVMDVIASKSKWSSFKTMKTNDKNRANWKFSIKKPD